VIGLRPGGGPALAHEGEEVSQCFLVGTALFDGELAGALVELRGHPGGLCRGTTQRDERGGELLELGFGGGHGESLTTEDTEHTEETFTTPRCAPFRVLRVLRG